MAWSIRMDWGYFDNLFVTLQLPRFVKTPEELRAKCTASLENPGFGVWAIHTLLPVGFNEALSFTNWHTVVSKIAQAISYAAERSSRGERITCAFSEAWEVEARKSDKPAKTAATKAGKKYWKLVRNDNDIEDFVDLCLDAMWVVTEHADIDEVEELIVHGKRRAEGIGLPADSVVELAERNQLSESEEMGNDIANC